MSNRWQHFDADGKAIQHGGVYRMDTNGLRTLEGTVFWDKKDGYVIEIEGVKWNISHQYKGNRVLFYPGLRRVI